MEKFCVSLVLVSAFCEWQVPSGVSISVAFATGVLARSRMPSAAFAASVAVGIGRGTFIEQKFSAATAKRRGGLRRNRPKTPVPVRTTSPTTCVLGLPRVFGGRSRDAKLAVEPVVEVPVTPELTRIEKGTEWARAHPFRAGMFILIIFVYAKRAVDAWKSGDIEKMARGEPISPDSPFASPFAKAAAAAKNAEPALQSKAMPKRHETTEEAMDLLGNTARKYVIVGGKGGVGKTSSSCAIATQFADRGQVTLIVSTDPAHSLSDAFDQPLSGGEPIPVVGIDNLYAQEINPDNIKQSFNLMGGGADAFAGMGDMGLDDLNSLFDKLPPGFDEAAALAEIVKLLDGDPAYAKFDRIVFDTAPTGHTLRLMSLPDFLNGFVGKIMSMKSKFQGVMNQFKGMFDSQSDMDDSFNDMEELKRTMAKVRSLFTDQVQTEFIVATIPNMMAIAESKRLVEELKSEQVPVRHLFVNHCQPENTGCEFCSVRHKEQASNLKYIRSEFSGLRIATVQSFDREIRGAAALRAMGSQLFPASSDEKASLSSAGESTSTGSTPVNGSTTSVSGGVKTVIRPPPSVTTAAAEIVDPE